MNELTLIDPDDIAWVPEPAGPQASRQSAQVASRLSGKALALLAVAMVATGSIATALVMRSSTLERTVEQVGQPTASAPVAQALTLRSSDGQEAPRRRVPALYGLEGPRPPVPALYGLDVSPLPAGEPPQTGACPGWNEAG